MAFEGHVGYTVQAVLDKKGICLFVMSPQSHVIPFSKIQEVYDSMFEQATINKSDWRYWYDSSDWRDRLSWEEK